MSVGVYADDVVAVVVTPDSEDDWRSARIPGNIRPSGAVMPNMFVDNSLNRLRYYHILEDGSERELDMDSGVENLTEAQSSALGQYLLDNTDALRSEAGFRDCVDNILVSMTGWMGGAAGGDPDFSLRVIGLDLVNVEMCIFGEEFVRHVFPITLWEDESLRVAFEGDEEAALNAVLQIAVAFRNNLRLHVLFGDVDGILEVMPEPIRLQWMDMLRGMEYVGGERDSGVDRFFKMAPWMDGLGLEMFACWFHTVYRTGILGMDRGYAWGVHECGILEAHGIAIGTSGDRVLYIGHPSQEGRGFVEYEFLVEETGVMYAMMNDDYSEFEGEHLAHLERVIESMNTVGLVDF